MSVEFRQRTPAEYAQIFWRRRWLIILPTLAVAAAISWVVIKLPNIYESTTLLIVKPSTIPNAIVPTLSDVDLTMRINNISQEVMSRSSLQPLIEKYQLYKAEQQRGEKMEELVERMRKDIRVEVDKSRDDVTNAFRIWFRSKDQRVTQAVTAELASKYITAQTKATTDASAQTKQFFEQQLAEAKAALDAVDQKRLQYMQQNVGHLPSESAGLVGQLAGLREQQKALITETGRLRDQRTLLSNQLGDLMKQSDREIIDIAEQVADPKSTVAYAELVRHKAQLDAELQNMLTTLKPKNPDVVKKQAEIESVKSEMDKMIADGRARIQEKKKQLEGRVDPRITTIKYNIQAIEGELVRQQRMLDSAGGQISDIERRINSVPSAEVGLEALNREYITHKTNYDQLLEKQQKASLAADVATNAQGETIQVVDPANFPETPVLPQRLVLIGLGLVLGFTVGLMFAAARELPRLLTIQSTDDVIHYTGLPVLAALPLVRTPKEETIFKMRRMALAFIAVALTLVSIPGLAFLLKVTRVLEIVSS
jgi:polysaccharide chain length determinant protein (PEP-CTERM system associated)